MSLSSCFERPYLVISFADSLVRGWHFYKYVLSLSGIDSMPGYDYSKNSCGVIATGRVATQSHNWLKSLPDRGMHGLSNNFLLMCMK